MFLYHKLDGNITRRIRRCVNEASPKRGPSYSGYTSTTGCFREIDSRDFSDVGFFTNFEVSENLPLVEPPNFTAGNVDIQLENLPNGAGCVLFIRDGKISLLECYTFSDP